MSGRPHIKITESVESLREILKQQKRILAYNKVQMLYFFQSKQVETVREVSAVLGKSEATIHRWLFQYKEGGLENLLKHRQVFGRPKKFSGVHLTFADTSSRKLTIEMQHSEEKG